MNLSAPERAVLRALAEAALPPGRLLPGAGPSTLARVEAFFAGLPPALGAGWRALLWSLELRALLGGGRFSRLPLGARLEILAGYERTEPTRLALRGLLTPLKLAYFDDPAVHAALGCRYAALPPASLERERWRDQVTDAAELPEGEPLECDVVVVGTGAGGAPVAAALAERGLAVLMIEEGPLFSRADFTGRPVEMMKKLYRDSGATVAFGNTAIPIPLGRGVGGTTLINSGTCFRVPEATLAEWRDRFGLGQFTPELLAPHYQEVERELGVGPSPASALGRPAQLVARGCDALGFSHHPLRRNAPGCDGQGLCCFGCPTDAKRSTNVSWVPRALKRGAQLVTGLRVERVVIERGSATGVEGRTGGRRVAVRAKVVVLACGALQTPELLWRSGACATSGELGRNLSIHPASAAIGLFDEEVNAWNTVPQGYAIDQFKHEGLYFEGATVPLDLTAASLSGHGPAYVALMEQFNHTLHFGFMLKDASRGRVRPPGAPGPKIAYSVGDADLARLQRGFGLLARVFFAAGAREVHAPIAGFPRLRSLAEVERLERARLGPRQVDLSAYHPLGTARMGTDPLSSVVDHTHETWDVHHLFVCDGASVPGSLGVNPQLTIMAMGLRASEFVARRVERLSRPQPARRPQGDSATAAAP